MPMNEQSITIRRITPEDAPWILLFMTKEWGSDIMVTKGKVHHAADCNGLIALDKNVPVGLLLYVTEDKTIEIIGLNAITKQKGIGTALLQKLEEVARNSGATKIWVITTNDNLDAMRFYQKRGFMLSSIYPNAIAKSRAVKPQIPLCGDYGIPLRDEIELSKKVE